MPVQLTVATCALLTLAACSTDVSHVERVVAAMGLLMVVVRVRRPELLGIGVLLGVMAFLRIEERRVAALEHAGKESLVVVHARDDVRGSARLAWLGLEDGAVVDAWVHGEKGRPVAAGERLHARARLWIPPTRRNPDDRNRHRSELAAGALLHATLIESRGEAGPSKLTRFRAACADWMDEELEGSAPLWRALLLADRSALDRVSSRRLQTLGLAHLLSLSGLHVGVVVGAALLLLRRRRVPLVVLTFLFAWLVIAGPKPSLLRAVVMVSWIALGQRLERRADAVDALAFAAMVDLALWPWRAMGVGWWLSYAATLSLLRARAWLSARRAAVALLGASTCAQFGGLPWVLGAFGKWVWFAPVSNLALATLFSALLVGGMALLAAAASIPALTGACVALLQLATHGFGWLLDLATRIAPASLGHPGLSEGVWALALAGWFALFVMDGRRRWRWPLALFCWCLPHVSLLSPRAPVWWSLDVGQGDAGVYRGREGWMVVDAGPAFDGWSAAEGVVLPFLERRNATDVTLLLTHGHLDHYGDTHALLASGRVSRLVLARADSSLAWAQRILRDDVETRFVSRGDSFALGHERIGVLWPPARADDWGTNDRSVVVSIGPPHARLLLTGDLEREAEDEIEDAVAAPFLKLGHHGANTSTHAPFLDRVAPRWAIASCGTGNRYGHPHDALLARLAERNVRLFRTDQDGAIELRWEGTEPILRAIRR